MQEQTRKFNSTVLKSTKKIGGITIKKIILDLADFSETTNLGKLNLRDPYLYQGGHFVSSLFCDMLVVSDKFQELQIAVCKLPYFEKIAH